MSLLLNFDFIDNNLVKNTINYLNDEEKSFLLKEPEQWDFNGTGFKNKTKLYDYMRDRGYIYKKELIKNINSNSRRTNEQTVQKMYQLFKKDTPLFIDTERLYRMLLLSSNLIFTPNEKICFTVMFENPYKQWSAEEIIKEAKKNNLLKFRVDKIEESLDRYLEKHCNKESLVTYEITERTRFYRIHFTNFINYIRKFDK